ncbi:hypothetical protein SCA6_003661 [Theobroma cacao]
MISMKRQEVQNSRIKPAEMISNEDDILINGSSKFSSVLFLRVPPSSNKLKYHFFSLNENPIRDPIRSLTFADDSASINILQSCNGLLLCYSNRRPGEYDRNYYIYNPTINKYTILP